MTTEMTTETMEETSTMEERTIMMTDPRPTTLHLQHHLQEEIAVTSRADMDTARCAAQEDKIPSANATTTSWPAASAEEDGTMKMTTMTMTTEMTTIMVEMNMVTTITMDMMTTMEEMTMTEEMMAETIMDMTETTTMEEMTMIMEEVTTGKVNPSNLP